MVDDRDLRARILIEGASGKIEEKEALGMLSVLSGAPPLRPVPSDADKALGKGSIYETLDSEGEVLVAGRNYLLWGEKVKVLREQQGAGNMIDVYMRVFYLNGSLEEKFIVVEGRYPNGLFDGAVYKSQLQPIETE